MLEALIAKFGDSFYAELAKAKLAELKKEDEIKAAAVPAEAPASDSHPVESETSPQQEQKAAVVSPLEPPVVAPKFGRTGCHESSETRSPVSIQARTHL